MSINDHSNGKGIICLSQRRAPLTMGLLWITMVTSFPGVLQGFLWFKSGLSFSQVLVCTVISSLIMLAYAWPASHIGSISGWSYGSLIKSVFGRAGSRIVAFNLIWMFIAWYGLCALFLAEGLEGMFHCTLPLVWVAPVLAVIMAFNNYWGFKGVANFARFFAAPLLIIWVSYCLIKTLNSISPDVLQEPATASFPMALSVVTNFVIGFAVWGNEADYWRYGKPQMRNSGIPISIALMIGMIVFPTTGFLVAHTTGITDYGKATAFMNDYSFGGIAILGALVIAASYFACNDSNLYGSSSALAHLSKMPHKKSVTILTICGAIVAGVLSSCGCAQALEKVASLNCVVMAMPTVLLAAEYFLVRKLLSIRSDFSRVADDEQLPLLKAPAVTALAVGCIVGIACAGVIPALEPLHVGICSLQGWFAGLAVYIPMRWWEHRQEQADSTILAEARNAVQQLVPQAVED